MKPIEILRRYQQKISLVDDCVLEQVWLMDSPTTVQSVIVRCLATKIASPATLHKALSNLAEHGLIKTVRNKQDSDNRKRWLVITAAGQRRLKELS